MQKITTHLWFDAQAKEAAAFYVSVFGEAKIKNISTLSDTPSGTVDLVTMDILGQEFSLMSAGPMFKFTPAISFLVGVDTAEEVDMLWEKLSVGGIVRMELGSYPFSKRYGWIEDKYGVSWQLMFTSEHAVAQRITPTLLFTGAQAGHAEEAIKFYTSIFHDAKVGDVMRYGAGEEPDAEGTIKHASFTLEGQAFAAMDSAYNHQFTFTEAISLMVHCQTQAEIDAFWSKLSAHPEVEQCGWLKDQFGVSWQIVPTAMEEMLKSGDATKIARVTKAFLQMKKFDIAALRAAFDGT